MSERCRGQEGEYCLSDRRGGVAIAVALEFSLITYASFIIGCIIHREVIIKLNTLWLHGEENTHFFHRLIPSQFFIYKWDVSGLLFITGSIKNIHFILR